MKYHQYEQRLAYLVEMATKGRFITVAQVATNISCNKRTVRKMLNQIRSRGTDIHYSYSSRKFVITPSSDSLCLLEQNTL